MDIKLKNNKKTVISSIIIFLIIIIASVTLVNGLPKMAEAAKENSKNENYNPNVNIEGDLVSSSLVLNKLLREKEEGRELEPAEIYKDFIISEEESRANFNSIIFDYENYLYNHLKNLNYGIKNNSSQETVFYGNEEIKNLLNGNEFNKELYRSYIVISYDENGRSTIVENNGFSSYVTSNEHFYEDITLREIALKNVTIAYAVPTILQYDDRISQFLEIPVRYAYENIALSYAVIFFGIIGFIALVMPRKVYSREYITSKILKVPFEILFVGITLSISLIAFFPFILSEKGGDLQNIKALFNEIGIGERAAELVFGWGSIILFIIVFYGVFLAVVTLKNIHSYGFVKYIKERTISGKIIIKVKNLGRNAYNGFLNIDLNDKSNKLLFKVLGVNFIILSLMCSIWFFGLGISIAYTIVLFFVLRKYFEDVKKKYSLLLDGTNKIAQGNLDVTIEEDLGLFEPLKGELEKIQKGFRKAVNEEVKSQRMKSELVSNVSHDLKTPLTSIITYVDLLKQENITEEERASYIDTIDRKSQRLKNLIEDLFEMSKASTNNVVLNLMDVDIVELIKQTKFELSDKIQESSLNFRWNLPEEKIILSLDSQKTFRVFQNLLINALNYSMDNSRVYVDVYEENENILISFKNTSKEEIDFTPEEIVERFARGDKSRNTAGSGLGLAIAKSFVELQGGSFSVGVDGDLFKVIIQFKK